MEHITCSSFSPKYRLLQQTTDGLMRRRVSSKSNSIVPQIHGVANRSQCKKSVKCSQSSFLSPTKLSNTNCKSLNKYRIPVTFKDGYASKPHDDHKYWESFQDVLLKNLSAFYRFTRPYSLIGSMIAITSVSFLPLQSIADLNPKFLVGLLKALLPTSLMIVYQNGLNQLYDVEIDKMNKPYLPLASGELSMGTGIAIVCISALISVAMGIMFQSPPLLLALLLIFLLGTAYSADLPFLRWKRNSFLTAMYIMTTRGFVYQFAFFTHFQNNVFGRPAVITRPLIFASAFISCLCVAIAFIKDIPDEDGDKEHGIRTLSVILGKERVFWLCIYMLLIAYGAAVTVGASSSSLLSKLVTVIGHSTLAAILWHRARSVDLFNKASITSFYIFIWKLYYAEYILLPFVR